MQRPTSVTVLGVLNILFGVTGICGGLYTFAFLLGLWGKNLPLTVFNSPVMNAWMWFGNTMGLLAGVALIAAGSGLLKLRNWARKLSIGYAVYSFGAVGVGLLIHGIFVAGPLLESLATHLGPTERIATYAGLVGGFIGSLLGLVYPTVLWYFMSRSHIVAACNGQRWQFESDVASALAPLPASRLSTDNPYASPQTVGTLPAVVASGQAVESAVEKLIPLKNKPALLSYYLGLFSLFPVLGLVLAIPAFVLGIIGLSNARQNPAVRGKVHAWIGVACSLLFGMGNLALLALILLGFALR